MSVRPLLLPGTGRPLGAAGRPALFFVENKSGPGWVWFVGGFAPQRFCVASGSSNIIHAETVHVEKISKVHG